jgi:DNA-binding transcriptional MerR regulator
MLIGEVSKKTGLSRDTIRFYEEYPETVVDRLNLIKTIQDFGFTLKEIDTFFELWKAEDASCENLVFTFENKLVQVEQQIQYLNQLKEKLTASLEKCKNDQCEFEKSVPSCVKCQ